MRSKVRSKVRSRVRSRSRRARSRPRSRVRSSRRRANGYRRRSRSVNTYDMLQGDLISREKLNELMSTVSESQLNEELRILEKEKEENQE